MMIKIPATYRRHIQRLYIGSSLIDWSQLISEIKVIQKLYESHTCILSVLDWEMNLVEILKFYSDFYAQRHPVGRALISDWSANSLVIVGCIIYLKVQSEFSVQNTNINFPHR